jgi:hypothetical protein
MYSRLPLLVGSRHQRNDQGEALSAAFSGTVIASLALPRGREADGNEYVIQNPGEPDPWFTAAE